MARKVLFEPGAVVRSFTKGPHQ